MDKMKISLVFLTLDEIEGLKATFSQIPFDQVDEVFAIDGGSTDGTIEFFREKNIKVYLQDKRGRGEAFRLAFKHSQGDALIFFSPDGNENPLDIPKFRPFLENGHDMVIGTRMVKGARNEEDDQFFKWRKWANLGFNLMANMTWNKGKFISDSINGFRAITKEAWQQIALDGNGYTIEYQSSIRVFKKGLKVAEFPTYEFNRIGPVKGSPSIATGISFLKLYLREIRIGKNWQS